MKHALLALLLAASFSVFAQDKQPAKQCADTTTKGQRCKLPAKYDNKCHIHSDKRARCNAPTSKNKPCRQSVAVAGQRCRFHPL